MLSISYIFYCERLNKVRFFEQKPSQKCTYKGDTLKPHHSDSNYIFKYYEKCLRCSRCLLFSSLSFLVSSQFILSQFFLCSFIEVRSLCHCQSKRRSQSIIINITRKYCHIFFFSPLNICVLTP